MAKPQDIVKHELIGLNIEVTASPNKSLVGKCGKIVDETRSTMTIEEKGKFKKVLKSQITFKTKFKGKIVEVFGRDLVSRPEERIKRR
ncbi:MAG: ribonuclease P protein subunit [Candidatus Woesearchaeota archaeon]